MATERKKWPRESPNGEKNSSMESRRTHTFSGQEGGRRKLQEPRRKETADGRSGQVTSAPRLCVEEGREGNGECSGTYKLKGKKTQHSDWRGKLGGELSDLKKEDFNAEKLKRRDN